MSSARNSGQMKLRILQDMLRYSTENKIFSVMKKCTPCVEKRQAKRWEHGSAKWKRIDVKY